MTKFDYTEGIIEQRVREHLKGCSPLFICDNKDWYIEMRKWLEEVAIKNNIDVIPIIGCFSALSPQCSVKWNKIFLEEYLKGVYKHTQCQIEKCHLIVLNNGYIPTVTKTDEDKIKYILKVLNGLKTQSFFDNLVNTTTSQRVTIDRHILLLSGIEKLTVTKKEYKFVEKAWQNVAKEVNLLPMELQAVLWQFYRINKGINKKYD